MNDNIEKIEKFIIYILNCFCLLFDNKENYQILSISDEMIEIGNINNERDFYHITTNIEMTYFTLQKGWGEIEITCNNTIFNLKLKNIFKKIRKYLKKHEES